MDSASFQRKGGWISRTSGDLLGVMNRASSWTERGDRNRSYLRLEVWQSAMNLFVMISKIIVREATVDFRLRSQLVDAAQSVSSKIAEGFSRQSINEYLQFLYVAMGSLSETLTRSIGLRATETLTAQQFDQIDTLHYEVENKLTSLIAALEKRRAAKDWDGRLHEDPSLAAAQPADGYPGPPNAEAIAARAMAPQ